jgi:hypothetical protein
VRTYILLFLASGTGFAGTLTTSVYGAIGMNGPVGIPTLTCSQSGSASAACSVASGQDSLSLQTNADFGNLSGTVMGSSADTNFFQLEAMNGFTDTLTINAAGTPSGFVEYLFKLTGQAFSSDYGIIANVTQDNSNIGFFWPYCCASANGLPINQSYATSMAPFVSGAPFTLGVTAQLDTFIEPGSVTPRGGDDNLDLMLTGILVFDQNGNLLTSGVDVSSASSTYGGLVTLTPEPGPFVLTLFALLVIGPARCLYRKRLLLPRRVD